MPLEPLANQTTHSTFKVHRELVRLRTQERLQFVDLTGLVRECVRRSGISHGLVNVQTRHTTTAVVVNENEPLLLEDLKELLRRQAPRDAVYRHDDFEARTAVSVRERPNGHSHARAVMLRTSESLNIVDGRVDLGRWQSVFLVELDGLRRRAVSISVIGVVREEEAGSGAARFPERSVTAAAR